MLVYGSSGDFGGNMLQPLDNQWIFYYLYDLAIRFVLLNVVRGITVDTFSELRELKLERLRDTQQTCFICGINKQIFDRDKISKGFNVHIKKEHNMWNYLFFMIHIWEQDKDDDDGLEQYVRRCIESIDINWIPAHKAMSLSSSLMEIEENETNQTKEIFNKNLSQVENNFMTKMNQFQSEVSTSILTSLESTSLVPPNTANTTNQSTSRQEKEYTRIVSFNSLASLDEGGGGGGSSSMDVGDPLQGGILSPGSLSRLPSFLNSPSHMLSKSHTISSIRFQFAQAAGPTILIEVVEITGLTFPSRILETISCVIRTKHGATSLGNNIGTRLLLHENENPVIVFDPLEVIVSQGYLAELHHEEQVTIQITRGHPPRYVGKVELILEELCREKEQRLQKFFYGEVHETTSRGVLVINTKVLSPEIRSTSPELLHSTSSPPLILSELN
jgi:hypothetical protein